MELDKAEVHEVDSQSWPDKVKEILLSKGVTSLIYGLNKNYCEKLESLSEQVPDLTLIKPIPIGAEFKETLFEVGASFTEAKAGIAETGTLVLWPDHDEPRLISLVPPIHFVLLDQNKIYNSFKEIISKQNWENALPTNALLISGPSKTADIEFNLAWGIHGPCELIVLLINSGK
ncbi:MAG: lactate utilization protein [Proteobacteria bacterium]|nr:lactate utilization protein [Pseudomonadota bacterium]